MSAAPVRTGRPFSDAHVLDDRGGGRRYRAVFDDVWAVGPKAHGGMLLVLLARAALARLAADTGTELDPLAVSAAFLRAPDLGPVELVTEPLKIGRTVWSCVVRMEQGGNPMLHGTITAGVLLPPTVFNLGGRPGWAPSVQLTALLRGRPAPGWLRVDSRSGAVVGTWFDEDLTVVDSAGRLVCQARQLALTPLPGDR